MSYHLRSLGLKTLVVAVFSLASFHVTFRYQNCSWELKRPNPEGITRITYGKVSLRRMKMEHAQGITTLLKLINAIRIMLELEVADK